jgi:hypothetical protein
MSDEKPTQVWTEPDWFLGLLVNLANRADFDLTITLTVGGLLISGRVIGASRFFREVSEFVKQKAAGISTEVREALFDEPAQVYEKERDAEDRDDRPSPRYIHLRDARVYDAAGNRVPRDATWWRGRLDAVDGFMIGALEIEK